jgi:hypothetical protein
MLWRIVATIAVGSAACVSVYLTSGTVRAVDYLDRTDSGLVELSHYISDAHASIRSLVAEDGSREEAIADFNTSIDRRLAGLRSLNAQVEGQTAVRFWITPLRGDADLQRIVEERDVYVGAAKTTLTTPVFDPERGLRMFDLQAQKLIQSVAAVRDSAATARGRALLANDTTAKVSSGLGALLIAYLLWRPVFGGVRPSSDAIL